MMQVYDLDTIAFYSCDSRPPVAFDTGLSWSIEVVASY